MRAVLDTNVVVSALIWGGKPFSLFQAATGSDLLLFTSSALLEELRDALSRSHTTNDHIAAYLEDAAQDGDPAAMAAALGTVARARNVSQLARDTGMTREGIYKALSPDGNPAFATIVKLARAMGLNITFTPRPSA